MEHYIDIIWNNWPVLLYLIGAFISFKIIMFEESKVEDKLYVYAVIILIILSWIFVIFYMLTFVKIFKS